MIASFYNTRKVKWKYIKIVHLLFCPSFMKRPKLDYFYIIRSMFYKYMHAFPSKYTSFRGENKSGLKLKKCQSCIDKKEQCTSSSV